MVTTSSSSCAAAMMMTQCRKQLFKRGMFSSECHYSCLNDIGCFHLTSENEKLILSVLTLLHIPVVWCDRAGYLGLRLVIPAGPGGRSWDVCLTTRQTVMKDGRRSRKRRRRSSNQSVERPRRRRLVGTKHHQKVKTLQKQSNQHAPRPRQPFSHLMVVKGRWLVYYLNEQDFPPWNPRAGFYSEQISLITSFNSVRRKKEKSGNSGEAVGNVLGPWHSDYKALCKSSVVHLLKHCHPAISFVYLPDTTRRSTLWLPTDSPRTAELHEYLCKYI